MIYDQEEYNTTSTVEIEMLIVDLPIDLMKENIKYQINDPSSTDVDYLETFFDKINLLLLEYSDHDDAITNINNITISMCNFVVESIQDKFDLNIDLDTNDVDECKDIAQSLYDFLVLRYKKNISKFIYKYIKKNKKALIENFSYLMKQKDVSSLSLKKKLKNKDDIVIISNLSSVIKFIIDVDIDPIDFFNYLDSDRYETIRLVELTQQGRIVGNFLTKYFDLITGINDILFDEIMIDIKQKLIKKWS